MGILDILQGNDGAASPWGALYPSPLQNDPQQLAAIYAAAGMTPPQVDPFGDPSKSSVGPQQAPPTPPATGFGAGAAPFSFAGPGSNMVAPSQIAQPAPAPQPAPVAAAPAPAAPAAPASAPDQAAPIAVGGYQMPRIGASDDFEPDDETPAKSPTDVSAQSRQSPPATAPFSLGGVASGIGDRLGLAGKGFLGNMAAGPIGALAGGLGALVTGKPTDAASIAQQNGNQTAQALIAKGASPADVVAASKNPPLMAALIQQYYGKDKYKVQQTGEDAMGRKTFQLFNESDGTFKAIPGGEGGGNRGEGLGDMSKTGAEYLATLPPQQAQIVKGMVDGTIQPPSSFALAKPAWQAMLAAAKNLDPNFDANTWATRHKMSTDMAASGNSSMGGILANGKSAFSHLADLSGSMADLGNASHDFPGGGGAAAAQNYIGNRLLAGSDTLAKIKAINDNLGHYGQESTKFYSGTGGGVEERMNALKEVNPVTTSSEEMAAYLSKEKSLMQDRLVQKEAQVRDTMGDTYLQKHPVFTPDLKSTLATIDANIAKLRGQAAPAAAAAPALPQGWSVQVH